MSELTMWQVDEYQAAWNTDLEQVAGEGIRWNFWWLDDSVLWWFTAGPDRRRPLGFSAKPQGGGQQITRTMVDERPRFLHCPPAPFGDCTNGEDVCEEVPARCAWKSPGWFSNQYVKQKKLKPGALSGAMARDLLRRQGNLWGRQIHRTWEEDMRVYRDPSEATEHDVLAAALTHVPPPADFPSLDETPAGPPPAPVEDYGCWDAQGTRWHLGWPISSGSQ